MFKDSEHTMNNHRIMIQARIEIMQEWLKKPHSIQSRSLVSPVASWVTFKDTHKPSFNFDKYEYRIKPKNTTIVPWHKIDEQYCWATTNENGSVVLYNAKPVYVGAWQKQPGTLHVRIGGNMLDAIGVVPAECDVAHSLVSRY